MKNDRNIKYPKIISNGQLVNSEFPDYKNGNFQRANDDYQKFRL